MQKPVRFKIIKKKKKKKKIEEKTKRELQKPIWFEISKK